MTTEVKAEDDPVKHRQRILIPATFGIHSMIQDELRDYISEAFGHSTFSFHEVFLDRPVMWFQELILGDEKLATATAYGTTQPFLSRFVYHSGLTPAVNLQTVRDLQKTARVAAGKKFNPLKRPLVATDDDTYHRGLENLKFPMKHSIFLRGLLEIWLKVENRKTFLPKKWKGIDRWGEIFKEKTIPVTVGGIDASPGSNCYVSVIGELNRNKIRNLYGKAVEEEITRSIEEPGQALTGKIASQREEAALALLREYHVALRPWIDADKSPVVIAVSISSNALFWGECVLILPASDRGLKSYEGLLEILVRKIQSTFLPILTIFENYVLERQAKGTCEKWRTSEDIQTQESSSVPLARESFLGFDKNWIEKNLDALGSVGMGHEPAFERSVGMGHEPVFDLTAPEINDAHDHIFLSILSRCIENNGWNNRLNEIERGLTSLWAARFSFALSALQKAEVGIEEFKRNRKLFEESLVFENYLVASPAILTAIVSAMALRHGERSTGEKPTIKTALVIGGPGSGKDSMAKLVRLFSPGYRLGPLIVLNMASFRPKEAAVPLLLGLSIWDGSTDHHPEKPPKDSERPTTDPGTPPKEARPKWSIASLLGRAWAEYSGELRKPKTAKGGGLSFIFDELNSLDLDTQGALLRFLESGELLSLGDFKNPTQRVDALIIGVMNEDPNTITKVRTIDRIVRDKQVFGGLLGDFLYEFFRGKRRLRDDLYFRMARGGEIVMPELRQRRQDIPLLFFLIVQKDLESSLKGRQLEVELSAYELLMDPSLQWEGNVRELQALAREVASTASTDDKSQQRRGTIGSEVFTLRGTHVRSAIDHLTRKSQPGPEELVEAT